jgi:hypothetical protein
MARRNFHSVRDQGEAFSLDTGKMTYTPGVGFIVKPFSMVWGRDYAQVCSVLEASHG